MSRSPFRSSLLPFVTVALLAVAALPSSRLVAQAMTPPAPSTERLFTVLIFERTADLASRTSAAKSDAYWASYDAFAAALIKAGALRGGSALDETVASTVRGVGSADKAVAGGRLGGYFVIAAPSLAAAEQLAKLAPSAALLVEVRPHRDNPRAGAMPK